MNRMRTISAGFCPAVVASMIAAMIAATLLPVAAFAEELDAASSSDLVSAAIDLGSAATAVTGDMAAAGNSNAGTPAINRIAGAGRYETMSMIVEEGYPSASEWAVIATGANFPDALAASSLAGSLQCPVVLTESERLSGETVEQLTRLGVENVYIMGGEAAVSKDVEEGLAALGITPYRVEGGDRVETSIEAMRLVQGRSDTVIIATGNGFADTLSIGPWAYASSSPIVLTQPDRVLSQDAIDAISECGYTRYIIVGGTAAVSGSVEDQLSGLEKVARLAGDNRYATSKAIAEWEMENGGLDIKEPAVATGGNFPDALAGASLCGKKGSVLLLADEGAPTALTALSDPEVETISIFGGTSAVPPAVLYDISAVLRGQIRDLSSYIGSYGFWNGKQYVFVDIDKAGFASLRLRMGTYNDLSTTMDITDWFSVEITGDTFQYDQIGAILRHSFKGSITLRGSELLLTPQDGLPKTLAKRSDIPYWWDAK